LSPQIPFVSTRCAGLVVRDWDRIALMAIDFTAALIRRMACKVLRQMTCKVIPGARRRSVRQEGHSGCQIAFPDVRRLPTWII